MEIIKGIQIADLALYIPKHKALIISDVHIGYEEALNKQGIMVPRMQFNESMKRIDKITSGLDIEKIIINGDLKHEFGKISDQEWRETLKFLDFFKGKEIILIKGNHDKNLGPIAEKRDVKVVKFHMIADILVVHGDKLYNNDEFKKAKTIIIGHEHPAVSIIEGERKEKYKCYLLGKWKSKKLIVMPSFSTITEGTDILQEEILSPFLKGDLSSFEVFVVSDKVYEFGKLKNITKT